MSTAKERGERIKALAREYRLTQKRWPSAVWDDLNREIDSLVEQAGAVPLTDEQIDNEADARKDELLNVSNFDTFAMGVRFAERSHGIKEGAKHG